MLILLKNYNYLSFVPHPLLLLLPLACDADECGRQYKTRLSKSDARAFHRPALQFPTNIQFSFSKVRSSKKKKDSKTGRKIKKGDGAGETLRSMSDISLKDTGPFVLWEYSVRSFLFWSLFFSDTIKEIGNG